MELRVGNKYRLGRKIGSGSFGDIYLGESLNDTLLAKLLVGCLTTGNNVIKREYDAVEYVKGILCHMNLFSKICRYSFCYVPIPEFPTTFPPALVSINSM